MFHWQTDTNNWNLAVRELAADYPVKSVDDVQLLAKLHRVNPHVNGIFRKWYDHGQQFGGSWEDCLNRARTFFDTFLNESFFKASKGVRYVETWNEYLANHHGKQARIDMALQERAFCEVWYNELQPKHSELSGIDLCLVNVAVGNDISLEFAEVVRDFNYRPVLGYHGYVPVKDKEIRPNEWLTYSGRFVEMDRRFVEAGIDQVQWLITEAGAVEWEDRGGHVHLVPLSGWQHENVFNGVIEPYYEMVQYWLKNVQAWNKDHGNRCRMGTLFTVGSFDWLFFEHGQHDMEVLAMLTQDYPLSPVEVDPPVDGHLSPIERKILNHALANSHRLEPANAMLQKVAMGEIYDKSKLVKTSLEADVDGFRYSTFGRPHTEDKLHTIYYVPIGQWAKWESFEVPDELKL